MNYLKSIRISQKIMFLVAGLALGFVAIGIAYYVQMSIETNIRQDRTEVTEYERALNETRVDIAELNRLLMHFVAYRQAEVLQQQAELTEQLSERMVQLRQASTRFAGADSVGRLSASLDQYAEHHAAALEQAQILGATTDEGLRLALANGAQALESQVDQWGDSQARSAYSQIRRYERDFIATQGTQFLGLIERQADLFAERLAQSNLTSEQRTQVQGALSSYLATLDDFSIALSRLTSSETQLQDLGLQMNRAAEQAVAGAQTFAGDMAAMTEQRSQLAMAIFIGLIFMVVMGMAVGVYLLYKSIVFPMAHMQSVIRRINKGNLKARVRLMEQDELGDLGRAFNALLDERINTLEEQAQENEQLNNSIISLIRALGAIAQKNLTIKVPVSADITGTISDAVNLFTSETAKTLAEVKDISIHVNRLSDTLQEQSLVVVKVAEDERKHVMATSKALDMSARAMNEIASKADLADKIATKTISDTQSAREAVVKTVDGILTIRETISETEKRIKRLGDRSQEISGIVSLINTIAERTHILALNASMHAASAGEAGKGFAVVADEVQRLAENAREATGEIASMVNNIRVETSDTVNIMNKLIAEVAQGTRLADQAGKKMAITEDATRQLVETVQVIAHSSGQQANIANRIRDRANIIRLSTEKTGAQLAQQKRHTDSMKHYAEVLLQRVNVFELPEVPAVPLLEETTSDVAKRVG